MSNKTGGLIVVSGPSGVGKTLFLEKSLKRFPQLSNTISFTTRKTREGEKNGDFYYFITKEEFEYKRKQNELLEWAVVHDNLYATSIKEIERLWSENKTILKDIDVQGFHSIKKRYPHCISIFIYPPSINELKNRILKRGAIEEEQIKIRLKTATQEMSQAHHYDFQIINDSFQTAWVDFESIIKNHLDDNKS